MRFLCNRQRKSA